MIEAKHTQTQKWRVEFSNALSRFVVVSEGNRILALLPMAAAADDDLTDFDLKDLYMMAAAPELLDALDEAKQFIQNGIQYGYINMPDKDCGDSAIETPAKIEAAIQKARVQG